MSERLVRIGVVGTSWWTETFHLPGLASHPQARVTAICGRDRARAEMVAASHGVPEVFSDYREMFSRGRLDAVVIATPDDLHREMALQAFASGLHVLCEKPLARTADDARAMLAAARSAGAVHMAMFTWRWIPVFAYLHRLIEAGYLGSCRDAQFVMHGGWAVDPRYEWRFDPQRGSGVLGDLGSHMIDLARWYVGDISQVSARLVTHVTRPGPDGGVMRSLNDSALLLVEFASGAQASIDVSAVRVVGELPGFHLRLYGDEGSLEVDLDLPDYRLRGRRRGDSSWQELSIPPDLSATGSGGQPILGLQVLAPFTNCAVGDRLFVDAVLEGRPAEPTFEDGWRVQQVVDAAVRSDLARRWVSVGSVHLPPGRHPEP